MCCPMKSLFSFTCICLEMQQRYKSHQHRQLDHSEVIDACTPILIVPTSLPSPAPQRLFLLLQFRESRCELTPLAQQSFQALLDAVVAGLQFLGETHQVHFFHTGVVFEGVEGLEGLVTDGL